MNFTVTGEYLNALDGAGVTMLAMYVDGNAPAGKAIPRDSARAPLKKYHRGNVTGAMRNRIVPPDESEKEKHDE